MNKPTPLWQVLSAAVTLLIAIATGWITMNNKVSRIEAKQELESVRNYQQQMSTDKKFDKIDGKIDDLGKDTRQILIELQNKADRPK